jgi:SAM-dependent methyltransferase
VRKTTIGQQVREIYEERPYPAPDQGSVVQSGQLLPAFEWIRAMCAMRGSSPKRILVAGCGTGPEAFALQKRFCDAEVVGIDFSSRSILQAKALQKRVLRGSPIRLRVGDLTNQKFMSSLGDDFDFISCHGVLSYIPQPTRALQNISRCLSRDGALYLGVNSAAHFSAKGRPMLRALGFDVRTLPAERHLRRVLRLYDALAGETDVKTAKLPLNFLAGDLFGPLIHNLSLSRWIRLCHDAGLVFAGHYYAFKKVRYAINEGLLDILRPRSRAEVHMLIDHLDPCGFHQMAFSKRPSISPAWQQKLTLNLPAAMTSLYRIAPTRRRKLLRLKSLPINTLVEIDSAGWENQFLSLATGANTVGQIWRELPKRLAWEPLCKRLYLFYQLGLINFQKAS